MTPEKCHPPMKQKRSVGRSKNVLGEDPGILGAVAGVMLRLQKVFHEKLKEEHPSSWLTHKEAESRLAEAIKEVVLEVERVVQEALKEGESKL